MTLQQVSLISATTTPRYHSFLISLCQFPLDCAAAGAACCSSQIINTTAEEESPVKPSSVVAAGYDLDALGADDLEYNYDIPGLAALRRRLTAAIHDFKGAHAQYEEVIKEVGTQGCSAACWGGFSHWLPDWLV
jgi:hypothetical protein